MGHLVSVFANAAIPQKLVLLVLLAALPAIVIGAALARGRPGSPWRRLIADLRLAGPLLGLLTGAMNSFHMADTISRLPFDPTAKQLAPGVFEVSTLIGLGALVGLAALAANRILGAATSASP